MVNQTLNYGHPKIQIWSSEKINGHLAGKIWSAQSELNNYKHAWVFFNRKNDHPIAWESILSAVHNYIVFKSLVDHACSGVHSL